MLYAGSSRPFAGLASSRALLVIASAAVLLACVAAVPPPLPELRAAARIATYEDISATFTSVYKVSDPCPDTIQLGAPTVDARQVAILPLSSIQEDGTQCKGPSPVNFVSEATIEQDGLLSELQLDGFSEALSVNENAATLIGSSRTGMMVGWHAGERMCGAAQYPPTSIYFVVREEKPFTISLSRDNIEDIVTIPPFLRTLLIVVPGSNVCMLVDRASAAGSDPTVMTTNPDGTTSTTILAADGDIAATPSSSAAPPSSIPGEEVPPAMPGPSNAPAVVEASPVPVAPSVEPVAPSVEPVAPSVVPVVAPVVPVVPVVPVPDSATAEESPSFDEDFVTPSPLASPVAVDDEATVVVPVTVPEPVDSFPVGSGFDDADVVASPESSSIPGLVGVGAAEGDDTLDTVDDIIPTASAEEDFDETDEGEGESACFPGNAHVTLESGSLLPMSRLNIGDRVKTADGSFSPVVFFTHRQRASHNPFLRISTSAGRSLTVSQGHYLYVNDGQLRAAVSLSVGDALDLEGAQSSLITSVESVSAVGLFNPQTVAGSIIVNGFKASTYTTAVHPSLAHDVLMLPVRWMHALSPALSKSIARLFDGGSPVLARLLPSGPYSLEASL